MVLPLSYTFNQSGNNKFFGAGIKGTIRATTPVLNITNGNANARTTVSFHRLKGGIRVPLKGWTWVSLTAPNANVVVTHTLTSLSKAGLITFTCVESIKVSFSWPTVLKPVENLIKGLLKGEFHYPFFLKIRLLYTIISLKKFEFFLQIAQI